MPCKLLACLSFGGYDIMTGVFQLGRIGMDTYTVKKTLNNNVLIALNQGQEEVVLIGKGIGFHYKKSNVVSEDAIDKLFILQDKQEQAHYKELLPTIDNHTLEAIITSTELISRKANAILNEHIHVALTDHLVFAINRLSRGLSVKNPFLSETKALYPFEYEIAAEVVDYINQKMDILLPEGEVGFIALHVHSAIVNKDISDINKYSQLVKLMVETIEDRLNITIDKDGVDYIRLIRHIRYTIERVINDERLEEPGKIAELLKTEYPECYNLSWKLIKIMQQTLKKSVYDAESVYLTLHLERLYSKYKNELE